MNDKWIFDSLSEWRSYLCKAFMSLARGIFRVVYTFIGGIASFLYYLFRLIAAFCKREFVASLVMGFIFVVLSIGWISTYMNGMVSVRTAEYQRDSIGYKLDKMMQAYDGASLIIVDNDTLYNAK